MAAAVQPGMMAPTSASQTPFLPLPTPATINYNHCSFTCPTAPVGLPGYTPWYPSYSVPLATPTSIPQAHRSSGVPHPSQAASGHAQTAAPPGPSQPHHHLQGPQVASQAGTRPPPAPSVGPPPPQYAAPQGAPPNFNQRQPTQQLHPTAPATISVAAPQAQPAAQPQIPAQQQHPAARRTPSPPANPPPYLPLHPFLYNGDLLWNVTDAPDSAFVFDGDAVVRAHLGDEAARTVDFRIAYYACPPDAAPVPFPDEWGPIRAYVRPQASPGSWTLLRDGMYMWRWGTAPVREQRRLTVRAVLGAIQQYMNEPVEGAGDGIRAGRLAGQVFSGISVTEDGEYVLGLTANQQ